MKVFSSLLYLASIYVLISFAGTPQEVYDALNKLGFDSFRCGQEEAIMQILCGNIQIYCTVHCQLFF